MRVSQASKMRNDPLGVWQPYGTASGRGDVGEWAPLTVTASAASTRPRPASASVGHRRAPQMPRSHYIGAHLQIPPYPTDPLEERAVKRAVSMEAYARTQLSRNSNNFWWYAWH